MMKGLVIAPKNEQPPKDRRDVRRTIEHWVRNASGKGQLPALATSDFASIRSDWSQRFLVCTEQDFETAAFVAYGINSPGCSVYPKRSRLSYR